MLSAETMLLFRRLQQEMIYASNRARQLIAQKLIDYYDGKQLDHLDAVLKTQFAEPTSLAMQKAMDNITRFVTDEISRVFDQPATLSCQDPSGNALLESLTDDGVLSLVFKTGEVLSNLNGICGLHPWFDVRSETIKTTLIPASTLFVAQRPDDPTEADAVIYMRQIMDTITDKPLTEYVHWDDGACFVFSDAKLGNFRPPSPDNPDMINPYGVIPFAWLRDSLPVGTFFPAMDEGLLNAQDNLNVLLTAANQLAKFQGFAQPVMVGHFDEKNPVVVDPSKPIRIPPSQRDEQPADFRFVSPESKIGDILAQISDLINRTTTRRGISMMSLKDQAGFASGYALKIANSKLERKRVDSIPLARAAIKQWWEIVKRIHNTHFPTKQVPLSAMIDVDFAEPQYQEDPTALLDKDLKEIAAGLSNPVQVMMRNNPDLTEAEAKAAYDKNIAMNKNVPVTTMQTIVDAAKASPITTAGV